MRRCDAGTVRIEIMLDGIDPPVGRIAGRGGASFCGWIDLLAVLSGILEASRDEKGELGPRAQPELREDV